MFIKHRHSIFYLIECQSKKYAAVAIAQTTKNAGRKTYRVFTLSPANTRIQLLQGQAEMVHRLDEEVIITSVVMNATPA